MKSTGSTLRSGELARLTGLSPDTIRHYERRGILPQAPRTASGYRVYSRDAVERVQLVQRALQLGFTMAEILRLRDDGGVPCQRVLRLTEEKLSRLEQQIAELQQAQRHMRQLLQEWRKKLAGTGPGSRAMLLQSFSGEALPAVRAPGNFRRRKQT